MDTLKDMWASLVAGVQERTTNPLTFSFIASWCLWNYKFFFILAGDGSTTQRLTAVDALYPSDLTTYLGHALGAPLLTAVAYVFLYPSLSAVVIERYRKKQVAIANAVREIEGKRLLTVDESRQQTRLHETERVAWQERESTLVAQLQATREALSAAERQASDAGKVSSIQPTDQGPKPSTADANALDMVDAVFTSNPLDNLNTTIAKNLSQYIGPISLDVLASNLKINPLVVKSQLQAMADDNLVTHEIHRGWSLTPEGEKLTLDLLRNSETVSSRLL
nr:hypothetical protein [uncultured Rhodoferax sp.]